ncbi:hypothetical protein [Bradyrhizobium sp. NP1]|uniref:hypothetical protein n=1 Tax=Bradyrhizobium sp. NP1 TaxID=3049772 RepID=UPI0025A5F54A|nr:hypothetical protein [Bradyrhizobium sp. NP1]WJR80227.1 hypothetical protein QOU61_10855 [Bradyrhizobium sp. NP1]
MDFESAGPSVVKSIRQRVLLNAWLRLFVKSGLVPAIADFEPERAADELRNLALLRVDSSVSPPQITFMRESAIMAAAYGEASEGRSLDEYMGPHHGPVVLPVYFECIRRARPTYTIFMYRDLVGRSVAYERLLLPFATAGRVTDIFASHNNISEDGKFEANNLIRAAEPLPEPALRAVIDRDLVHRPQTNTPAGDIVEI